MTRLPRPREWFALCAGLALAGACAAGSVAAGFTVQINLVRAGGAGAPASGQSPSPESCLSSTVTRTPNTEIQVLCTPGQFVNIQPASGLGSGLAGHAGRESGSADYGTFVPDRVLYGAGEMTSLRVLSLRDDGRWLEMLVSF